MTLYLTFTGVLDIQTQVPMLTQQVLCQLSHLPGTVGLRALKQNKKASLLLLFLLFSFLDEVRELRSAYLLELSGSRDTGTLKRNKVQDPILRRGDPSLGYE